MATRNPSLNIRPDLARAATAITGPSADDELVGARGAWWWTGKAPADCPGWDKRAGVLRSLPLPNLRSFSRQSALDYFDNSWTLTEVLFASLQTTDAFIRQPYHQLRHPMMFYYGHPAVLYINKFRVAGLLEEGINPFFEQLFETGVDEMSWDDLSHGRDDWPPVREMHAYRQKAYAVVRDLILNHPSLDKTEVGWDDPAWAVFMGFEHERIHIETSSVLIRELPLNRVRKPEFWPEYHPSSRSPSAPVPTEGSDYPLNSMVAVRGETVVLGKDIAYPSFGWDNEYGRKEVNVSSFRASKFKVTNGEFLRFVKAGGYSNPKFWSVEGWGWKTFRNVKWPTFWMPDGPQGLHRYKLRVLFDAVDMRWDWPVDANYHEARAFAAWRTEQDGAAVRYRLCTEAEHNLLRNDRDRVDAHLLVPADHPALAAEPARPAAANERASPDAVMQVAGDEALAAPAGGFNIQLAYGSQSPVTELPPSSKGFHDTLGNAWEWGEDHYAAFPGFKLHPFYEDFSAPCFAGKHQLIMGGSFVSTGQLASKFARYQFRPHFFQHATFRLVQTDVDLTQYDCERYGTHNPVTPFYETSCMDSAPPYAGDGPCCSVSRRTACTPTAVEEAASTKAKLEAAQVAYENDAVLAQYLSLHYGPVERVYPEMARETGLLAEALHFPRKLAECLNGWAAREGLLAPAAGSAAEPGPAAGAEAGSEAGSEASGSGRGAAGGLRALDLGCAVGRSTFEMARVFGEVVGVDISKTFIEVAAKIRDNGRMDYECCLEGEITERLTAALPAASGAEGPAIDTSRCRFVQGDACSLPSSLGQFDAVLAANLLCRVPEPAACVAQIRASLRPGGVALLTSPYSWLEAYTDRGNWVGGRYKDGRPNRSADALKALLAPDFDILEEGSMPLLIREHGRKYQLINAHKLVLRRKQ